MNQFICDSISWIEDDEKQELSMVLTLPEAKKAFEKLLKGATQADLSFTGNHQEGVSYITFVLRNGNGELEIQLPKSQWEGLLDEPEHLIFEYGDKFEINFLPRAFSIFIDEVIEKYNDGQTNAFIEDIIDVFTDEG